MKDPRELFRVPDGGPQARPLDLARLSTDRTPGFDPEDGKKLARELLREETARLVKLQERLYAGGARALLVVFQALDTGGKDGVIKKTLGPLNPQGVRVESFKKPTPEEAARDFLWRIHRVVPKRGMIGVFNRSHYEDILVPSVWKLLPGREVEARYGMIREFEEHLADNGTTLLKFYLHISKDEQKRRLQKRLDNPEKRWKFDPGDLESRKRWPDFMKVYGRVLARTSAKRAPWYAIPADRKWFRDLAVARILRLTLEDLRLRRPPEPAGLAGIRIPD